MILNVTDVSSEPLQSQIVRQLRARILSGSLAADSPLPSIRGLAREARVSVITVQRAYEQLERDGLIYARRGKGFFCGAISAGQRQQIGRANLQEKLRPLLQAARQEGVSAEDISTLVAELLQEADTQNK